MHVPIKSSNKESCIPTPTSQEGNEEPPDPGSCLAVSSALSTTTRKGHIVRFPSPPTGSAKPAVWSFRKKHFPCVTTKLWNDWRWQTSNRIRNLEQLEKMIMLSDAERAAFTHLGRTLPLGITPYYMSLVAPDNPEQPVRRTVIPTIYETVCSIGEADDPLGEDRMSPVPGLVHRYPDRVLLLLSDFCSTYCRYCTRSRMVGHGAIHPSRKRLEKAFSYIAQTPAVRDVLLSGGDPLMLGEEKLSWILSRLRQIPHVEIVRIGTKVPAVLPQRITGSLVRTLRKYHPLWMSLHFTHPDECTPEAYRACTMLADAGIPLGSQTVLLRGINDTVDTMRDLVHNLLKMRVRPYYLYQCDPITGSSHFRTTIETGLSIIRGLRGFTSGYALPTYVIDAPGGGGKIPLMPDYIVGREQDALVLKNYENKQYRYPETSTPVTPG
ncbi:KamA1: L-lysine 2,3-aminomutase [Desulfosarcina variabilis str. Montpellier]|uniref:KamA family radical SAM protein n=1 Tax=Desulfosarcina variabilis TaxID=2300 RepID=UPI003AFB7552